jgi:hypothetical protein
MTRKISLPDKAVNLQAQKSGRWKPGESGNPKGRAPGSGEVAKLRASIGAHVPEIIAKLVEKAKDGDSIAARLLLDRILPPIRATDTPTPLDLPEGSLTDQGKAVLGAIATGDLAPAQGAQVLSALGALAKIVETDDLMRRVADLEKLNAKP